MSEELRNCVDCVNKGRVPGSAHVYCKDPPDKVAYVGACGPGLGGTVNDSGTPNYETAEKRLEAAQRMARNHKLVVLCVWPRCGYFPGYKGLSGFDALTVKACHKFKEK